MKKANAVAKVVLTVAVGAFALTLAACSPQPSTSASGNADDTDQDAVEEVETVGVNWTPDSDCSACHGTEAGSMEDSACLASVHKNQGATCATCHTDEETLTQAHANAEMGASTPSRLSSSYIASETCLACHDQDELIVATADLDVLTDSNGTTVNPHSLPQNADHDAEVNCSSCHKMHDGSDDSQTEARRTCNDCHHEGVYECYTCHA